MGVRYAMTMPLEGAAAIAIGLGVLALSEPFSRLLVEANDQTWIRPKVRRRYVRGIVLIVGLGFMIAGVALVLRAQMTWR